MHKASTLIGLTLVALGAGARAEESAPAAPPPAAIIVPVHAAPAAAPMVVDSFPGAPQRPPSRFRIGLSFLPMGLGKLSTPINAESLQGDASFAYGVGLAASVRVIAGFSVGVAPQIISNVNYKVYPGALATPSAVRETDLMARLAYTFPVVDDIGLYVAVLPGYSIIGLSGGSAKGLVVAFEGGVDMGITDRIFANFGAGYQLGFQSVSEVDGTFDARTRYVRVNLGGGVRF
jgi:hypothetical protein